jgi:hypothetical protein
MTNKIYGLAWVTDDAVYMERARVLSYADAFDCAVAWLDVDVVPHWEGLSLKKNAALIWSDNTFITLKRSTLERYRDEHPRGMRKLNGPGLEGGSL